MSTPAPTSSTTPAEKTASKPAREKALPQNTPVVIDTRINAFYYGSFRALRDVNLPIRERQITAFIGPSGCGKSTTLRCYNRLNEVGTPTKVDGQILLQGRNIYDANVDLVKLRRHVGMVFQQPNPFHMSIFDNIAFGLNLNNIVGDRKQIVEEALRGAALWDEVKDKLHQPGTSLSGGQQQRLCIARAIALKPQVLLMDEPCSALDPIATLKVEDLMHELKKQFTIVIVTHNMSQAGRVSDYTAFFYVEMVSGGRTGYLVEFGETREILHNPKNELTQNYLQGKFG